MRLLSVDGDVVENAAGMRCFVLGAGASRHAGYPLTSELFGELTGWMTDHASESTSFSRSCEVLRDYRDRYSADFEEILDHMVSDAAAAERDGDAAVKQGLTMARRDVLEAIRGRFAAIRATGLPAYGPFAGLAVSPGDTVITFNYDTAVETALKVAGAWEVGDGYGFTVREGPGLHATVLVLKLHGSVNWWAVIFGGRTRGVFTDAGRSLGDRPVIPDYEMKALGYDDLKDPRCPSRMARVLTMIPPLRKKAFYFETSDGQEYAPFFDALWANARAALDRADEILVLGYSMPSADERARDLLLSSCRDARITVSSGSDTNRIADEFGKHGFSRVQAIERRFEAWDWRTFKEDRAG